MMTGRRRIRLAQLRERLQPVHFRHLDVEDDQVGVHLRHLGQRDSAVGRRARRPRVAGSADSSSDTRRRKTTESSTTRTRIFGMRLLPEDVEHAQLRDQDVLGERLHDVLVGAGVERPHHLLAFGFRRDHHDAHARRTSR